MIIFHRVGGRRYPQSSTVTGMMLVLAAPSLGTSTFAGATLARRRYPQSTQVRSIQSPLASTSFGTSSTTGGGGGTGQYYIFGGAVIS